MLIDWCKENGNPKPQWEVRSESVVTTFSPSVFFSTGKTLEELEQSRPKIRPKIRPKSMEEEVISLLRKGPLSKAEISHQLGHKRLSGGLKKVFQNLINEGVVSCNIKSKKIFTNI